MCAPIQQQGKIYGTVDIELELHVGIIIKWIVTIVRFHCSGDENRGSFYITAPPPSLCADAI